MPGSTTNLGLVTYLTADTGELFLDFREDIAGNAHPSPGTGSNMWIIDDAVGDLDDRVTDLEAASPIYFVEAIDGGGGTYTATVGAISAYTSGMIIILKPNATVSTVPMTLNINSLGAKNVKKVNSSGTAASLTAKDLSNSRMYFFRYDGSEFIWMSSTSADTVNISGTNGNFVKIDANGNLADSSYTNTSFAAATHAATHVTGGGDTIANAIAGGNSGLMSGSDKTKLDGIASGADVTATALGAAINGATADTAIGDTDKFPMYDGALKAITWANIKSVLAAVFASIASLNTFSGGASGATGGGIQFSKGSGSGLAGTPKIDHFFSTVDRLRFWESGGGTKGAYIDLTNAASSAASKIPLVGVDVYKNMLATGLSSTIALSTTNYLGVGSNTLVTTPTHSYVPATSDMVVKKMYVRTASTQSATGSLVITLRNTATETAMVATIPAGNAAVTTIVTGSEAFTAGQMMSFKIVNNATATSAMIAGITLEVEFIL